MKEKVVFMTSHCPRCKVVEMKLKQKHIIYEECDDVDVMLSKGLTSAPALEVDGKLMGFKEAMAWLNGVNTADCDGGLTSNPIDVIISGRQKI